MKQIARMIGAELEAKGFEYWRMADNLLVFTREIEGKVVQVEVQKLSATPEFVQVGIAVDDGGFLNALMPPGISIVVRKHT